MQDEPYLRLQLGGHYPKTPVHGYALIDRADALIELEGIPVGERHWSYGAGGYAVTSLPRIHGKQRFARLHRVILGLTPGDGLEGDHINRNRLDNRRANLRIAPRALNAQNLPAQRGSTSAHRGVSWHKAHGKWRAVVQIGGKSHHLGMFVSELDAAAAASAFRAEHMPYTVENLQP